MGLLLAHQGRFAKLTKDGLFPVKWFFRSVELGCYILPIIFFNLLCCLAIVGALLVHVVPVIGAPEFTQLRSALAVEEPAVSDELFAKARLHGSVRVIVQLRSAAVDDDGREKSIEIARRALLDELAPVAHRVVRNFTAPPAIVLEASLEALQILRKSSHVLRVDEDGLAAPSMGFGESIGPIDSGKKLARSV